MKSLGSTVSKIAAPLLGRRGFGEAQMIAEWASVVGEALALETLPVKLSFVRGSRTAGTLHLRAAPGAALMLQHLEPQVLQRINTFFGYGAVARLAIKQGPLPRPRGPRRPPPLRALSAAEETKLAEQLARVADPELRAAVERLGRAVLGSAPAA